LFAAITENFGVVLGIPYLFLDPEYLDRVDFYSFLITGLSVGLFTMAFHVTTYIIDGPRFRFLGVLPKPFTKFCINNSLIPMLFMWIYLFRIINFQLNNELVATSDMVIYILGLLVGFLGVTGILFYYFRATNKDIFLVISEEVNKRIRRSGVVRSNILQRLKYDNFPELKIESYLSEGFRWRSIGEQERFYAKHDREMVTRVFDQNHFNTVSIQIIILFLLLSFGFFRDIPAFQIPAAASVIFLLTFFIIFSGALNFWFRRWSLTVTILLILVFNYAVTAEKLFGHYKAFGLDYDKKPIPLNDEDIQRQNRTELIEQDRQKTLEVLNNWRKKFPTNQPPRMVLVGVSGGGQRAALWSFNTLRLLDSLTNHRFFEHTFLMTGASGGLIGAGFYRELMLRKKNGDLQDLPISSFISSISRDVLNPVILTLIVNDLFVRHQYFDYAGNRYIKDRGYAFEKQLDVNTGGLLNKKLTDYYLPEYYADIPMMIISPTIINGARKLYISPFHVSYLNVPADDGRNLAGIDFMRSFRHHGADNLSFLTALRLNATFPYITPNVSLPTEPRVEIMDAGISDNFGLADAIQFVYSFKDWITTNTSGVTLVSVRDSEKLTDIEGLERQTMMEKFFNPVRHLYNNWWSLQDISNDARLSYSSEWFSGDSSSFTIQYRQSDYSAPLVAQGSGEQQGARRASLNWHLTTLEKQNILGDIYSEGNWNTKPL
jgi:hypothetical protein